MSFLSISGVMNLFRSLPAPTPTMLKRTAIVAASLAGLFTILSAANYFRRKRQKRFPKENGKELLMPLTQTKLKKVKRSKEMVTSTANSSPNSVKHRRARRHRNTSMATSFTSSSATSSIRNGRLRRTTISTDGDDESLYQVESLCQEGVDSFEKALHKWEEASFILQSKIPQTNNHVKSKRKLLQSPSDDNLVKLNQSESRNSVQTSLARSSSFSTSPSSKVDNNNYYPQSEGHLDNISHDLEQNVGENKTSFEDQLQLIIGHAQLLQDAFDSMLYQRSDNGSDTDMTLTGYDDDRSVSDESESNMSFVSAHEFWDPRPDDITPQRLYLYERALEAVENGEVQCRTIRSDLLDCFSDDEFLAKLHCLRSGFALMLEDSSVRDWLIGSGRSMIECILCAAERNIDDFAVAFSRMIDFVNEPENWPKIEEELKGRRVVQISFYDIVLDFLIMDAFDDLESPPSALTSIMQNRWLADSLKESALSAAVWSVLKAKRSRLMYADGFVAHLYDISEHISPVLAWGFLGPEGRLKDVCEHFKGEVISFLRDLFNFDRIRFTSNSQMADDILQLTRDKFESLLIWLHNPVVNEMSG
uniref:Mitoguardin-2-like n=1 Tax=Phallusia mammillata TaxID=59560 RepID=A0A6F9DL27_9ASCI|nr:mitoguardin-2-like [Phallusia mammillata]